MDLATLTLAGRLIFDVYKWITSETSEAELNRELGNGDKKHKHVAQNVKHKIDNYDLRPDFTELPEEHVAAAKQEAYKHVDRVIRDTVDIKNQTGEFVK
jgi:phosphoserine phosphatase